MDSTSPKKADAVQGPVAPTFEYFTQQLRSDHTNLVDVYRRILHERIFTNRGVLSPGMLSRIASEEADGLLNYLVQPAGDNALLRGTKLCEVGLSIQSLLGLGEASRQFFLARLQDRAIIPALQAIDSYYNALIQGFIAGREKFILIEQERLRNALQKALGR